MDVRFLNEYHERHTLAAGREVQDMLRHPVTHEQALAQVEHVHEAAMMDAMSGVPADYYPVVQAASELRLQPWSTGVDAVNIPLVDKAVEEGEWSADALAQLDEVVTEIMAGTMLFHRFPMQAQQGLRMGGRTHVAASLIVRNLTGEELSVRAQCMTRDFLQTGLQQQVVELWARHAGIWIETPQRAVAGSHWLAQGGEAMVYYDDSNGMVTKLLSLAYFVTPQFALDRITLHNALFPVAPLMVSGFTSDEDGEFYIVVRQPFVQGRHVGIDDIRQHLHQMQFDRHRSVYTAAATYYATDLHDENVILTPQGFPVVIDVDARLNTPDIHPTGHYTPVNILSRPHECEK